MSEFVVIRLLSIVLKIEEEQDKSEGGHEEAIDPHAEHAGGVKGTGEEVE